MEAVWLPDNHAMREPETAHAESPHGEALRLPEGASSQLLQAPRLKPPADCPEPEPTSRASIF